MPSPASREGTILDGEIVAFDAEGRPSFSLLAPRIQGHRVGNAVDASRYVVFDLLRRGRTRPPR